MRQFLCGTLNHKAKKGWVGCKKLKLPKEGGGVGIRKLRLMNKALHAIWRYGNEDKALWRRIVHNKFGENHSDFFPNLTSKATGKSLWDGNLKCNDIVKQNSSLQVNSGDRILFWKDPWLNSQYLKTLFPALYKISRVHDATIGDLCCQQWR